ncbi:thiolase-like protein [Lactarius quietus]|nr:thiolase-like protein [Lactarius quietus]
MTKNLSGVTCVEGYLVRESVELWVAATKTVLDACKDHIRFRRAAFVGYAFGESTTGQAALYQLCLTGIPITNVNNICSTGSAALVHAATLFHAGDVQGALALRLKRMAPGALGTKAAFPDCPSQIRPLLVAVEHVSPDSKPAASGYFRKYGDGMEQLAKISAKNHKHSVNNPYSQFRVGYDEAAVLASRQISNEFTKYVCCPTSDGAARCILANEAFVHDNERDNQAIELAATGIATEYPDAFAGRSAIEIVCYRMTRRLADKIFAQAGASRDDVVVELHNCFAANELVTYPALGPCAFNDTHRFVEPGENTYGGKYVVNPSGGPEVKGHPLVQLRNWLFDTPDARGKYGLVHNIGLGGAVVISLLRCLEFYHADGPDGRDRLGYTHAHMLRPITRADVDKVRIPTVPALGIGRN